MRLGSRYLIRLWAVPVLLAGVALAFDAADRRVPFSVLATGALDEPAHLATGALGLLALSCFIDVPRRFYVADLIASVAIDLDHIPLFSSGWGPKSAACHAFPGHRGRRSRGRGGQPSASGRAGRRGGRAADPFRPGHRRRPTRGTDALAAFKHGLDGQCPVVLGHDYRVHGRAADPGNPRHPPTRIRLFQEPVPVKFPSSPPIGRATSGDRDADIEMAGSDHAGADEAPRT